MGGGGGREGTYTYYSYNFMPLKAVINNPFSATFEVRELKTETWNTQRQIVQDAGKMERRAGLQRWGVVEGCQFFLFKYADDPINQEQHVCV